MKSINSIHSCTVFILVVQLTARVSYAGSLSQFSSHVSIHTPAHSFTHGVGDPVSGVRFRTNNYNRQPYRSARRLRIPSGLPHVQPQHEGYPKVKPSIPFYNEDIPHENSINLPWQHNDFYETPIPILPPSPYKVDSPDPESLWPEGLFLPPIRPHRFGGGQFGRRSGDHGQVLSDKDPLDPYLLEGTEAVAAVAKANENGELFFHLVPHIESLLANQEARVKNQLKPHRIASIRHTWPYNRP